MHREIHTHLSPMHRAPTMHFQFQIICKKSFVSKTHIYILLATVTDEVYS